MIGFVIWSLLGVFIIGLGIKDMFSKNPVGFWANTETIKVKDVKGYNRASGLLFIIYGIIFVILGIPLLVELVNLDLGKYKNVSHYGFNAVCKEQQYDWVCYMVKIHHTFCCRLLV